MMAIAQQVIDTAFQPAACFLVLLLIIGREKARAGTGITDEDLLDIGTKQANLQAFTVEGIMGYTGWFSVYYRHLEKSRNLSVIINIHILSSRFLGQTGHGEDIASQGDDKACSGGDSEFSYGYGKACGTANLCGIV